MKKLSRKQKNIFYGLMLLVVSGSIFTGIILLKNYHQEGSLSSQLVMGLDKSNWLSIHIPINILLVFSIMYHINDKYSWIQRVNPLKKKIKNSIVWRKFYSDLLMFVIISTSALSGFASFLLDPKVREVLEVHAIAGILFILFLLSHLLFRRRRFMFLLNKDPKRKSNINKTEVQN